MWLYGHSDVIKEAKETLRNFNERHSSSGKFKIECTFSQSVALYKAFSNKQKLPDQEKFEEELKEKFLESKDGEINIELSIEKSKVFVNIEGPY